MEWIKKPSFQDYLDRKMGPEKAFTSSQNAPSFVFSIEEIPKITPKRNPYPVKKISLEDRKNIYLKKWTEAARNAWSSMEEMAKHYQVNNVFPWQVKESFRKLALKVHPDQNSSPKAKEDFQRLHQTYKLLKSLV